MDTANSQKVSIPLAIIVAGAMIAAAIFFGGSRAPGAPLTDNGAKDAEIEPVTTEDHILGSVDAEVVVVEYSDLECPFCKIFHNTMHQIVDSYDGKVAWVYRHFPIEQLHSKAVKEAEASECAFAQGGNSIFWKYIDRVFELTESNDSLDSAELPKIADELNLDVTLFSNCLENGDYTKFIEDEVKKSIEAGALGTPYSVIIGKNGKQAIVNGAESFAKVKTKIDSVLK